MKRRSRSTHSVRPTPPWCCCNEGAKQKQHFEIFRFARDDEYGGWKDYSFPSILCLNLVSILSIAAGPPTCPADEWKGEFFPGIPKIKYEARFMEAAVAYKKKIGFNGMIGMLQRQLTFCINMNIECNHATLDGHSCHHELETARINGLLGNIDANTGDPQIARGLRNAAKLIADGSLPELVRKRYESFDREIRAQIEAGKADFDMLEKKAMEWGEPKVSSAKQASSNCIMSSVWTFSGQSCFLVVIITSNLACWFFFVESNALVKVS
ncbi:unnamed protein product [Fraxinus pennsylvanica]|uniref:xylose isomerase n=1 Tax=Fraxinus pennsylvanica TaxID=56036 RepID=A0AAD2DV43_9LAMI|nr:unnamed protein product [Fraxinus pennsylvanica]